MTVTRKLPAVLAAAAVAALALAPSPPAADDPGGFVRNRVSLNQTVGQLVGGGFVVEIRCPEACLMRTRLLISPQDATRLGFANVKPGVYFEIGRVQRQLPGEVWAKVAMRLTPEAKTRIGKSATGLKLAGQVVAASTESGRHGWASWVRTCRLRIG